MSASLRMRILVVAAVACAFVAGLIVGTMIPLDHPQVERTIDPAPLDPYAEKTFYDAQREAEEEWLEVISRIYGIWTATEASADPYPLKAIDPEVRFTIELIECDWYPLNARAILHIREASIWPDIENMRVMLNEDVHGFLTDNGYYKLWYSWKDPTAIWILKEDWEGGERTDNWSGVRFRPVQNRNAQSGSRD